MPEQWVPYLAVDRIDARYETALAAGATPMRPPFDVPGVGRIAILREPGGAVVGWMTPASSCSDA
jgi:predicted enzyme related to lactoylglutathione lyase